MNVTIDPLDPKTYGNAIPGNSLASTYSVFGSTMDYNWNDTINTSNFKSARVQIQGDAEFEGNITWQGRDMREWFESIESRLAILKPNPDLEREWSELAELRNKYIELERRILEKKQVFDILKKV